MDKQVFHLVSPLARRNAAHRCATLPDGWVARFEPKKRTKDQNAFSHAWYEEISLALPEDDALGWKCYCKLHHGVPILRAEDEEFRAAYDTAIKGLTYEQKLLAMRIMPVTSRMNVRQLTKYADAVRDDFAARGVALVVEGRA